MAIVVDANLAVTLVVGGHASHLVDSHINNWIAAGEDLHAPTLFLYEVANALAHMTAIGRIPKEDCASFWNGIIGLPIDFHVVTNGVEVIDVALQLQRRSAYDAAYIALAQRLGAALWTLDGPLYRNAAQRGYPVHLVDAS